MQCKLVLCEGKYDRCFIKELLSGEIYYTNEMKKFLELIRSFGERENIVLILECGGKEGLYKKVGDLVSKLRGSSFNAILMLDQDGGGDTFSKLKRRMEEFINTPCKFHPQKPILKEKKNATLALSLKNCFSNIFVAEVPESLESVVAKKLRVEFGPSTSGPHDLISSAAKQQLLKGVENECDIFKLAASDGWFRTESWFRRLSKLLSK